MRTINQWMRLLHRDIGFFTIGLVIIYSLSGIVLIYRDSDFFKTETTMQTTINPSLKAEQLKVALKLKELKVVNEDSTQITFTQGHYDKVTGKASYSTKRAIFPLNKFITLHKAGTKTAAHWFGTAFGLALIFMAISSFWMYKSKTKQFKRGLLITAIGIVVAVVLLICI
ncbi:MAG: hypothetical protein RR286_07070 [Mucinivorans sp.]